MQLCSIWEQTIYYICIIILTWRSVNSYECLPHICIVFKLNIQDNFQIPNNASYIIFQ